MQSISRRLSVLFIVCTLTAILLVTLFVNVTVTTKFNQYKVEIQNNCYERIVSMLEDIYKREGKWDQYTGVELIHDAYMGNYCLTLKDRTKKTVWGMNPEKIKKQLNTNTMPVKNNGVYTTKTFTLRENNKVIGYVDIGQYSPVILTEEDQNFKASINKSITASGIITLIIISGISIYFSKQFSNPIKEVAKQSVSLSNGNFEIASSSKSSIKEIENLRTSVNILVGRLKYQDMLRKTLVSDISHEIRTPLNILQNNLEAMIDGITPITAEKLNYLNEEVIRFGKLINNLNLLKQFESESGKFKAETIFLDDLIVDLYNDFIVDANKKRIRLDYEVEPHHPYRITGDKDQMKQVFINLLSNALKFTEVNGLVRITLKEDNKKITVEVMDTGIGIKQEDQPFIFERLYRGDKSRQQFAGNGIGLTIVNEILKLHNATIQVESQEGKGSKFTVSFVKKEMLPEMV